MKKLALILSLSLLLSACAAGSEPQMAPEKQTQTEKTEAGNEKKESTQTDAAKTYKIGILQIAEHSALDENREGFTRALEAAGIQAEIDYKNAQGDVSHALTMAKKMTDEQVDLIFAIGTQAAQAAKQAAKDTEIPILFSAVTDPVGSELVDSLEQPGANITGTSDKTPTKMQLELFGQLGRELKTIGVIYNTGETNSEAQLKAAEEAAVELGLTIVPVGITTVNDIPKALETLLAKTDAMYTLTDNLVAASMELISHTALAEKYIVVQSYIDRTAAAEGILLSNGFSYYDLGSQTGEMAVLILTGEKTAADIPVSSIEKTQNIVRSKALAATGVSPELEVIKNAEVLE